MNKKLKCLLVSMRTGVIDPVSNSNGVLTDSHFNWSIVLIQGSHPDTDLKLGINNLNPRKFYVDGDFVILG